MKKNNLYRTIFVRGRWYKGLYKICGFQVCHREVCLYYRSKYYKELQYSINLLIFLEVSL